MSLSVRHDLFKINIWQCKVVYNLLAYVQHRQNKFDVLQEKKEKSKFHLTRIFSLYCEKRTTHGNNRTKAEF